MQEVKIYTASPSDLSPPVQSESFCVDMVMASDYAELEAKYAALAADNDKAMESLKQGDAVVKLAHEKFSALAAENETLKYQEPKLAAMMSCLDAFYTDDDVPERAMMTAYNILRKSVGTPATDAFLAEMRAQAHKEGAYFVANRMLAAWDAGFIDDTAKNAADIARMILTSTEFMADAPEGDFDRSFADGVIEDIAAEALLDELDKKQQYIKLRDQENEDIALTVGKLRVELEAAKKRMTEQSAIVAAAEKLVRCKGRYHSELNYRALAKLFGVITPDLPPLVHENVHYADAAEVEITALRQRIAELEAKLETADKLQDSAFRDGLKAGFSYGQTDDQSGFTQCMSAYSTHAGIKREGE
ncbi:hypothetical protein CGL02_12405 [Salmonella enterica subsp. enterica serovar Muenchen]|nr:hypothetical protein [Salmonella enterica subsp. enterica serovar Muenchen]